MMTRVQHSLISTALVGALSTQTHLRHTDCSLESSASATVRIPPMSTYVYPCVINTDDGKHQAQPGAGRPAGHDGLAAQLRQYHHPGAPYAFAPWLPLMAYFFARAVTPPFTLPRR